MGGRKVRREREGGKKGGNGGNKSEGRVIENGVNERMIKER